MRREICGLLFVALLAATALAEGPPRNVILFGWDGAQRNHVNECLERGELPPIIRCDDPDPRLPLRRPHDNGWDRRWVLLKCTNGFAGQNGAVVLSSVGT